VDQRLAYIRLATIPIAPGIMLYRIVSNGSRPKPERTMGPKADIPDCQTCPRSADVTQKERPTATDERDAKDHTSESPLLEIEQTLPHLSPLEDG